MKPASRLLAASLVSLSVAGCRVGPKYVKPVTPAPPAFKESSPTAYTGAADGAWKPANPSDAALKGKWWEIFQEPELNTLEDQLDINNQNIKQYFQNFLAARAQVREARSSFFPTLAVAPDYTRTHTPGTLSNLNSTATTATTTRSGSTATSISLPFDVSWEPDLWGKIQNEVREYQYATQVSAADLENERLSEQASLAEFYFELRGQDALQQVYDATIAADRESLKLTQALVDTGIDSPEAVAQAEVTLANAVEAGTGVATNRAIYEHAIATLIGKPASDFSLPVRNLTTPLPPIPVGLPSQLLERRPDIAAAERTMAEANAIIGIEQAAYYPTLSLTGSGGLSSSTIGSLFSAPSFLWSVGSTASETIFDAGLRRATVAQYTANFNADVAAYRQTTLTAFQQVEDYIATLRINSQQIVQQQVAVDAAQRYLNIATDRYKTGLDPYLNVITAQTTLLSDQQTQVTLRTAQMTAAVQLIQALGGGWDTTKLPAANQVNTPAAADQVSTTR
ncbi:efflux transporter outer membrane subunit [Granulicella sibirica]|uniref:Heavy metal RND efflux outer membrane protein, CzcC family n=1 Tax=Granulicella sibirica TaxID=2479048 RepID=A0A4Q0SYL7_9BACT|nr:efflux transporter outer membrane subunit [Granulicella sibirica]RXH54619.1 Heavy metal RND efflux outer membrane protein, CzcC family [Granulicella sibirica]